MKNKMCLAAIVFMAMLTCTAMLAVCAPAQAAAMPTLSGAQISATQGETVLFAVSIKDNPGLTSWKVYLSCDVSVFSVPYDEETESYAIRFGSAFVGQASLTSNYVNRSYMASGYKGNGVVSANGEFLIFELAIDRDAPDGEYPITIQYSKANTLDGYENQVDVITVNGKVSVGPPTFQGSRMTARPGETIDYAVNIAHNPGLSACMVYIASEDNILTPVLSAGEYTVNRGNFSNKGMVLANKRSVAGDWQESDGWQVMWFWADSNAAGEGSLFSMPFRVKDAVADGVYSVTIGYSTLNTMEETGQKVEFVTVNGAITISSFDVSKSSATYNNAEKSVTVNISADDYSGGEDQKPVSFIAAVYDESGRMLGCNMRNVNDIEDHYSTPLIVPNINTNEGISVKLFALGRDGSLKPLCSGYAGITGLN